MYLQRICNIKKEQTLIDIVGSNKPIEKKWYDFSNPGDTHDKEHFNYNMEFLPVVLGNNWFTALIGPNTAKHVPQKKGKENHVSNLGYKN